MATREKKLWVGRKQNTSSPLPPKEDVTNTEAKATPSNETLEDNQTVVKNAPAKLSPAKAPSLAKKLAGKNAPKKLVKKTIAIKLKPTIKKNAKIKQKSIKALLNNPKNADTKKKLLKTCVKQIRPKKTKVQKNDKAEENLPPVLEPILPIEEDLENKQGKKKGGRPPKIDNYAKKSSNSDTENLAIDPAKTKRVYRKKPKVESTPTETIEDVMNDLSSLIKSNEIKEEFDAVSESGKSDLLKPKKIIRRKKKENIVNPLSNLSKLSPAQRKVIDMLDLNVAKFKGLPVDKRRHSIEKFPIGTVETDAPNLNKISIFNNLPRCISPRTKNFSRLRQSADGLSRRSPYKTRSDSPARLLRNGKQRKLKDLGLLDGLETTHKKRRRNCSDFSGSEMSLSKFSGYESDSSFSDLSSVHGAENVEHKDSDNVKERNLEIHDDFSDIPKIKRSLSNEAESNSEDKNFTDTNSNVCLSNKENTATNAPLKHNDDVIETSLVSPSSKVPEKSIILDIMKQTFNDTFDDKEGRIKGAKGKLETVSTESFYNKSTIDDQNEEPPKSEETVSTVQTNMEVPEETKDETEENKDNNIVEATENITDTSTNNSKPAEEGVVNGNTSDSEAVIQNGHSHQTSPIIEETPENLAIKENILQALGLQSLKAAKEAKLKNKEKAEQRSDYTGTLKAVIKINRGEKKKGRNSMKMLQKNKTKSAEYDSNGVDNSYKSAKDGPSTSWKHSGQSSDTAGAHRKSHYSNRSNMDGSSEHTSDGETAGQEAQTKLLVIPEKASSFSIHPGRICKDECSYCFGKFGLFDTPCHIAQMKNIERQNKILAAEVHLTQDSCLCDACYRHIDRKANTPSYMTKSYKRNATVAPSPNYCHVLGCRKIGVNILQRKWMIKMRKKIFELINLDLNNPGLHSFPICDEHYETIKHLMVCAMCKRRLAKNHIYYLGSETGDVNNVLSSEGVPLMLMDNPIVCKLCKYYATIILKSPSDRPENSSSFCSSYKRRLLHFNDIVPMDEAAAEEPIIVPTRDNKIEKQQPKKKRKIPKNQSVPGDGGSDSQVEMEKSDQSRVPSTDSTNQSRPESPSDYMVDYTTLIPSIAMDCGSDSESKKDPPTKPTQVKKLPRPESVKQAVEISKKLKSDKSGDIAVQRLGSNPSISVRQLFPCEEDLPLQGHIEFGNVKERTPEGWEKCSSVIQYDMETKHLWQELQKPYGNQSSFLRHLILLEKYFRNGDLILSPTASHHSINYSESVHNRLRAYDNIPSSAGNVQPISMLPFNKAQKSNSGIVTSTHSTNSNVVKDNQNQSVVPPTINAANVPKSTPITISQLNSPPLIPPPAAAPKPKPVGAPPGLISLHPGTNRPVAPLVKAPQSQKIKFPITKNWRPNLIPIDPTKKNPERKAGLVQVISGGKPYHITLEDYKKMCAIKKSFELKQKRLQEREKEALNANKPVKTSYGSVLKSMAPRKGLVISKTTATSPKNDSNESENILEKLDKQVEKLETRLSENKPPLSLPKIPKSLTVIPQTVTRKPSRPSSPVLLITAKPKPITNKS